MAFEARRSPNVMTHPARPPLAFSLLALLLLIVLVAGCGDNGLPTAPEDEKPPLGVPHHTTPPPGARHHAHRQLVVTLEPGLDPTLINIVFGTTTLREISELNAFLLGTPEGVPVHELLELISVFPGVVAADLNWLLQSPESEQRNMAFDEGGFTIDDYHDQDFLARIQAPEAHAIADGTGVLVATIDTGVDLDHPVLAKHLALDGYDFVADDATPEDEADGIDQDRDGIADEAAGHGTHVAGLVLLGAPECTIMPVRVLDSEGWGDSFTVTQGILFAVDHGARVINMSLGMEGSQVQLRQAILLADEHGIVLVGSAGNGGRNAPHHYPAGYREVIAVTATDADDHLASFANYGKHIDLCAPGVGLLSTYLNGKYAIWSGTSMATPLVSAGAALLLDYNANMNQDNVASTLCLGAEGIEPANPRYAGQIGRGRLNLYGAITVESWNTE